MKKLAFVFLFGLLIVGSLPVLAHGSIERTEPADGALLPRSPELIKVWFSEPIAPESAQMSVIDSSGRAIDVSNLHLDPINYALLVGELPPNLPHGAYIVNVAGVVRDGHEASGSFVFWVGEKQAAGNQPELPAPAYGMVILFLGVLGLAGGAGLWASRRETLSLTRPIEETDHVSLE